MAVNFEGPVSKVKGTIGGRPRDDLALEDASDPPRQRTILVEFGGLTDHQEAQIDLHPLRAVGTVPPPITNVAGVVIEFWLRDGESVDEAYDDIRGWAIGNRLPIRGLVSTSGSPSTGDVPTAG